MKKIGILGQSIQHSISPILHEAAFNALNIEHSYTVWDVDQNSLKSFISEIKEKSVDGFNITIPYKESIMQYVDELDSEAQSIGAINTVINRDGILTGYNTDLYGISKTFELLEDDLTGKNITLIGSGGAAKSLCYYLHSKNIASLSIINRSEQRAQNLMEDILSDYPVSVHKFDRNSSKIINNSDVIINATPYGMAGSSIENELPPIDLQLSGKQLVFDLVYNPTMTPLLQLAKIAKCKYIGGLDMLVYQAAKAFEIWNDVYPNIEIMLNAGRSALEDESSRQ